ncbi:hypothetical protein B9G54_03810 [Alloscardovia macacae]|uniref:DUF624 domain-containing protein n=1 Tax=Alloscardovia macacae TaxID=1160091 RepID=A0A1Y2SY10_9BIFI|nr:YesL family protein [Alloscardovia macacae]OTA26712.1 hypothetical protein B9G54_03810 [Alloscardovia macacae]OTA29578.1 hypothetical protein B9T39_02960 [Alloscardovia macacae]
MDGFFNQNNWFYKLMGLIADLVVLNVITLIISLPLITAGSALSALHYSLWRLVRDEEGGLVKMYCTAFRENFRQVTPVWLAVLVAAGVGGVDLYFALHMSELAPGLGEGVRMALLVSLAVLTVLVTAVVQWYTVLVSRYTNTNRVHLKNAVLAAVGFFPQTLAMLVLILGSLVATVVFYGYAVPLFLLVGISLPQYCCALMYSELFKKLD